MEDFDVAVSSIVVAGGHNQGVAASPVDGSAWSTKNGARLEWSVKSLYNDLYHWICIHYQRYSGVFYS